MSIDFHAHHSPAGAYASFTCGRFRVGGGLSIAGAAPSSQDLVLGFIDDGMTHALPFYTEKNASLDSFVVGMEPVALKRREMVDGLERHYQAAIDGWHCGDFSCEIYTPSQSLPDPAVAGEDALLAALLPVVTMTLRLDNRACDRTRTLMYAQLPEAHNAPNVMPALAEGVAVSLGRHLGMAARGSLSSGPAPAVAWKQWSELDWYHQRRSHLLGAWAGLALDVPAGEVGELQVVLGFHQPGVVTSGVETQYYYTRAYPTLASVLSAGLQRFDQLRQQAQQQASALAATSLSPHRQFLLAHAERSYWGNTQMLVQGDKPCWMVYEGEYAMMNTFDLTVDQCFYELRRNPWVLRNILDQFVDRYSYYDRLNRPPADIPNKERPTHCRDPEMLWQLIPKPVESDLPGGISFCHDMGTHGHFSPPHYSSYECGELCGCFSYMTAEQLLNWICCAVSYIETSHDELWLQHRVNVLRDCFTSLLHRDDPDPARRDGVNSLDSSRCEGGWEITTYDSLDPSLGQSRRNAYMATKSWAAYRGLALVARRLGDEAWAAEAEAGAARVADTIVAQWSESLDGIPAVFEAGNESVIIPIIEGVVFPLIWQDQEALDLNGRYAELHRTLKKHLDAVLDQRCRTADGGWQLSSTADNTWMSKIFLCQTVAEQVYGIDIPAEVDQAHQNWQQVGCADWAFCDQIVAGEPVGSRYYPRGVTNDLWLGLPSLGVVAGEA